MSGSHRSILKRLWRWGLAGALLPPLLAILPILAIGCSDGSEEFLTATLVHGPIEATVSATGTLNPVHMVEVGTQASGRISSVDVDYNSRVRKGQRVAKIDPANALVRVQKAEASVMSAHARLQQAGADLGLKTGQLERKSALHEQTMLSEDLFEASETAHAAALAQLAIERASLAQAEAELADANVNLQHTDIVSPVDGIVLEKNVNVGQTVAASFRTPTLFLIARDLTEMQVNADVSESDIGLVKAGQLARFSVDAYPDESFTGRVREVRNSPMTVQNVVTYDVVIDVQNPELSLRPGMTATVTLTTGHKNGVLKAPLRALRFRPRDATTPARSTREARTGRLWVENGDGTPQPLKVHTGLRDDEFVEISSDALSEGDEVLIGYRRMEMR